MENVKRYFLALPNDNSRFYGVFRTDVLKSTFNCALPFHALDWYQMAATLMSGTHLEIDEVLMHRQNAEYDRYMRQLSLESVGVLYRVFPVLQMTRAFARLLNPQQCLHVFWPLLRLNFLMSMVYIKTSLKKLMQLKV